MGYKIGDEVIFHDFANPGSSPKIGKILRMPYNDGRISNVLYLILGTDDTYLTIRPITKANKFFKRLYNINEK